MCSVGPGKFEGESALCFLAWAHSDYADCSTGSGECGTYTDWFRSPLNFDTEPHILEDARSYGYCEACIREALDCDAYGLSVREDSYGFVYLTEYATREEFDAALQAAEEEDSGEVEP